MSLKSIKLAFLCFNIFVVLLTPGIADEVSEPTAVAEINQAMTAVRTGTTLDARATAAEQIAAIVEKIEPKEVDDETLENLVSLLDSPDDAVRLWIAGSLGLLGPRAKAALPKLLSLLPMSSCGAGNGVTSAAAIRVVIARINGDPMPPPQTQASCDGITR